MSDEESNVEDEEIFEVEGIEEHRFHKKELQFKIRWKGYSEADSTWEPITCFPDDSEILKKYLKENRMAPDGSPLDDVEDEMIPRSKRRATGSIATKDEDGEFDGDLDLPQKKARAKPAKTEVIIDAGVLGMMELSKGVPADGYKYVFHVKKSAGEEGVIMTRQQLLEHNSLWLVEYYERNLKVVMCYVRCVCVCVCYLCLLTCNNNNKVRTKK
jgi:hypothetical protein